MSQSAHWFPKKEKQHLAAFLERGEGYHTGASIDAAYTGGWTAQRANCKDSLGVYFTDFFLISDLTFLSLLLTPVSCHRAHCTSTVGNWCHLWIHVMHGATTWDPDLDIWVDLFCPSNAAFKILFLLRWIEQILWLSLLWACRFHLNITEYKTLLQKDQLYVSRTVWAMIGKGGNIFLDTLS